MRCFSNHFPTKALKVELSMRREIRTSLGDQGSQVRVLSPRFAAHYVAVQCSHFHTVSADSNLGGSVTLQGLVLIPWLMFFPAKPL